MKMFQIIHIKQLLTVILLFGATFVIVVSFIFNMDVQFYVILL